MDVTKRTQIEEACHTLQVTCPEGLGWFEVGRILHNTVQLRRSSPDAEQYGYKVWEYTQYHVGREYVTYRVTLGPEDGHVQIVRL